MGNSELKQGLGVQTRERMMGAAPQAPGTPAHPRGCPLAGSPLISSRGASSKVWWEGHAAGLPWESGLHSLPTRHPLSLIGGPGRNLEAQSEQGSMFGLGKRVVSQE